jgi:hypothetical protein
MLRNFESTLLRDPDKQILVGPVAIFESLLENTSTTMITGLRVPMSFLRSEAAQDVGFARKDLNPAMHTRDVVQGFCDRKERDSGRMTRLFPPG